MKKYLSLFIVSIIAALPLVVNATVAVEKKATCGEKNAEGVKSCTIGYEITEGTYDSLRISFTEKGGAEIIDITTPSDSEWTVSSKENWNVLLTSPGVGNTEGILLNLTYKDSGTEDCEIVYKLENGSQGSSKNNGSDPENPQTGSTLPYIALGSIALIAAGAYVTTRNKSKVYKI